MLIDDTNKYICMSSATTYYFDCSAERDGQANVRLAFSWAYLKNMGSLCMGSLIQTLIMIVKFLVDQAADAAA